VLDHKIEDLVADVGCLRSRTNSRSFSGGPLFSVIGCSEVRMRGPGTIPRATASRRSLSASPPGLWIVVKPASSVFTAFSTPNSMP
jgi:hypothetical protein